jgi:hypothetical protein
MRETLPDIIKQDRTLSPEQRLSVKVNWSEIFEGLRLDVWRERFHIPFDPLDCEEAFQFRTIYFVVKDQNELAASGQFQEWRFNYPSFDNPKEIDRAALPEMKIFFEAADADSINTVPFATAVCAAWTPRDWWGETPFHFGNVVHFDRLRIVSKSTAQSAAVWGLIDKLIKREFRARKRASIIVLKAYPLEYEGKLTEANEAILLRRQRAMMRLYRQRLDAQPLGRKLAKDGWMWIEINCPIRPKK